jgi:CheY-like chemotaxis protein
MLGVISPSYASVRSAHHGQPHSCAHSCALPRCARPDRAVGRPPDSPFDAAPIPKHASRAVQVGVFIEVGLLKVGFEVATRGHAAAVVAVVDDDKSVRSALTVALQSIGLTAFAFDSAESFLSFSRLPDVGCLVTDLKMPGMSGLELQAQLHREGYHFPIVVITAHGFPEARAQAMAAGAIAFLDKPYDDNLLLETVKSAIKS